MLRAGDQVSTTAFPVPPYRRGRERNASMRVWPSMRFRATPSHHSDTGAMPQKIPASGPEPQGYLATPRSCARASIIVIRSFSKSANTHSKQERLRDSMPRVQLHPAWDH